MVFRDPIAKKDIFKYILSSDVEFQFLKKQKLLKQSTQIKHLIICRKRPI